MAYEDPRLVAHYDVDNPDGPDHDFYRSLANEVSASTILDLGCGTGILTVSLVDPARVVVGIDPSAAMLAYARKRPCAERVNWIQGDSQSIPPLEFDYAVMTGNVAQHIGHAEWPGTLRDLREALRPGATLAFESRNPLARAWDEWSSSDRSVRETAHGQLEEWMTADEVDPETVRIRAFNRFISTGEVVVEEFNLRFRSLQEIVADLESAGFVVDSVFGDWKRTPFDGQASVMVFVASAR